MKIKRSVSAGTMESSDVYVEIEPAAGVEVQLTSVVQEQFGEQIRSVIWEVLKEHEVEDASIRVIDRGALECVIRARVETAIRRCKEDV